MDVLQVLFIVAILSTRCVQSYPDGIDFVGIGYNLLKGNPDGAERALGGIDPGFNKLRRIFRFSSDDVPNEIIYERGDSCFNAVSPGMFYGGKSYQEKLSKSLLSSGDGNKYLIEYAFVLSPEFRNIQTETITNRKVYEDFESRCRSGRVRLDETSKGLSVTTEFAAAICQLPSAYNTNSYMAFLEKWGTHVTTEVLMGNKTIERYETTVPKLIQSVQSAGGFGVIANGSYQGFESSLQIDFHKFKTTRLFKQKLGDLVDTVMLGSSDHEEPIQITVKTIDMALDEAYWKSINSTSQCSNLNTKLLQLKLNLVKALAGYVQYKSAKAPSDIELRIPITWPLGSYGLPKAILGCPKGTITWSEGSRYMDTNNAFNHNSWTSPNNLAGVYSRGKDITIEFCMKGTPRISEYDIEWPVGDYCIYKYNDCPANFESGFIYWDDQNLSNKDRYQGSLPDGTYDHDTRIFFCCRNDGLPTNEIHLPTDHPFYLFKYNRECQHVHGMAVKDEYVDWDENHIGNHDASGGSHPYDDGGKHQHRLHFCFYHKPGSQIIG